MERNGRVWEGGLIPLRISSIFVLQAPYVKKAEIAKKKYADEMAAYKKKAS